MGKSIAFDPPRIVPYPPPSSPLFVPLLTCPLIRYGPDFRRWHRKWGDPDPLKPGGPPRPTRAKNCIDTVRRIVAWGASQGARADVILGKLRFKALPARDVVLTLEHMELIRATAHAAGRPSVALAQVIQRELGLRQRDVCGEWEPIEAGAGGIVHGGRRWCNGLQWSDIDADGVLTKKTTKTGAVVAFDLRLYPSVLEEIALVSPERRIGPMIVCETTGIPYRNHYFSIVWRRLADKAGIPRRVRNMDSRAGSITASYAAGR